VWNGSDRLRRAFADAGAAARSATSELTIRTRRIDRF
jgi:hypothetical protein